MSKKLYEESNISAIANAIREKGGTEVTYKVSEMAQAIKDIPSGQIINNVFTYNEEEICEYIDESKTQIRYAKSNYEESVYPTVENWLKDESLIVHSGDEIDTSKSFSAITVWPDEHAYAAMSCLAINLNGAFLTDTFTIVTTENFVYSISEDFKLNKDEGMVVDIVYIPDYTNLIFPMTTYRTDLYDNCNTSSSMDARAVSSFDKLIYDATTGKVKNPSSTDVTLYLDDYERLHEYALRYISMLQRLMPELDWSKWDITQSKMFSMLLPCFVPEEHDKVRENLLNSIDGRAIISEAMSEYVDAKPIPFYVREGSGALYSTGISKYTNDSIEVNSLNYLTQPTLLRYMLPMNDYNGWQKDYVKELYGDEEKSEQTMLKMYTICSKLAKIEAVRYLCSEPYDISDGQEMMYASSFRLGWATPSLANQMVTQSDWVTRTTWNEFDHYDYIDKYYLPKDAHETDSEMRYYSGSKEDSLLSLCKGSPVGTTDNYNTEKDKYFIVVPVTFPKVDDKIYYSFGSYIPPFFEAPFVPPPNIEFGG